ncbi:MAG: hypothetical protein ACJAV5_000736 [Vicingaceae bacterium]|jgi:hypothetical protein
MPNEEHSWNLKTEMHKFIFNNLTEKTIIKTTTKMGLKIIRIRIPKILMPIFESIVVTESPFTRVAFSFHHS